MDDGIARRSRRSGEISGLGRTETFPPVASGAASGAGPSEAATTLPGAHFKPVDRDLYQRKEPLASGGMGRTFTAVDQRLGRQVVLKELPDPDQTLPPGVRDKLRQRLEQEARILAGLQHPNIVTVYEAGVWTDGEPFYAMSFVRGRELEQVVRETESLEQRLRLLPSLIAVSEAVAYAHGQGVIHRDLTPKNILIGGFGDAVIIDWGISKVLGTDEDDPPNGISAVADGMTAAGIGVPAYACPEQINGKEPDERFDVYSMGATLHFVLSGAPPFAGENPMQQIEKALAGEREPLPPGISQELSAIVDKAMHPDADRRYRSARELADELRAFQAGWLVRAHRYSPWERGRKWLRLRWRMVVIAAAALVALGALIGLLYYQHQSLEAEARSVAAQMQARVAESAQQRAERLRVLAEDASLRAGATAQEAAQKALESRRRARSLSRSLARTRKQRSWALHSRKQALEQAKREAELKAAALKAREAAEAAAAEAQKARLQATNLAARASAAQRKATSLAVNAQRAAGEAEDRAREATERARKAEAAQTAARKRLAAANQSLAAARKLSAARNKLLQKTNKALEAEQEQLRLTAAQLARLRAQAQRTRRRLRACRRASRRQVK
jgi:serine/threonine protein kinase